MTRSGGTGQKPSSRRRPGGLRRRTAHAGVLLTLLAVGLAGTELPATAQPLRSAEQEPPPPSVDVAADGAAIVVSDDEVLIAVSPADATPWSERGDVFEAGSSAAGVDYRAIPDNDGVAVIATLQEEYDGAGLRFDIDLPADTSLQAEDDGSIALVGPDGDSTAVLEPPWALDADGEALATSYTVDGSTIVQEVEVTDATRYPVTADPKFTKGYVTGTVYFDIPETVDIGDAGSFAAACGIFGLIGGPAAPAVIAVCAVQWSAISLQARRARRDGKCLKVKYPLTLLVGGPGVLVPGSYSGDYCKK